MDGKAPSRQCLPNIALPLLSLTILPDVATLSNMKAHLLIDERKIVGDGVFAEIVVWQVQQPVPGSTHSYKYRLAYVVKGACVLRYDNEAGMGDHKHLGERRVLYTFTTLDQLVEDFWADAARL